MILIKGYGIFWKFDIWDIDMGCNQEFIWEYGILTLPPQTRLSKQSRRVVSFDCGDPLTSLINCILLMSTVRLYCWGHSVHIINLFNFASDLFSRYSRDRNFRENK